MQVIRELDRNKRAQKNITVGDSSEPLRTRSRITIRKITELFAKDANAVANMRVPRFLNADLSLKNWDHI
jgi:hypothetical protein